jgi:hypothetical protein
VSVYASGEPVGVVAVDLGVSEVLLRPGRGIRLELLKTPRELLVAVNHGVRDEVIAAVRLARRRSGLASPNGVELRQEASTREIFAIMRTQGETLSTKLDALGNDLKAWQLGMSHQVGSLEGRVDRLEENE